jgi:hypothetical protein
MFCQRVVVFFLLSLHLTLLQVLEKRMNSIEEHSKQVGDERAFLRNVIYPPIASDYGTESLKRNCRFNPSSTAKQTSRC